MVELTVKEQMELKGGNWVIFYNGGVGQFETFRAAKAAYEGWKYFGLNPTYPVESQSA